VRKGG